MSATSGRGKERLTSYLFLMPAVIALFCIVIYPFLYSLFVSFHSWYLANPRGPSFSGVYNYISLLTDPVIHETLWRTLKFLGITIGVQMVLGIGLALWLNSRYLRWKKMFRSMFIIPMMIAPAVSATLWRVMYVAQYGILTYAASLFGFKDIGWIDKPSMALYSLCIVDIWQWTPFVMLIILAGLQSIDRELIEAAEVDGATGGKILQHITLPLLRPYIVIALIMRIIFAFRTFEVFRIITRGGPGRSTEPVMLTLYLKAFQYLRIGEASALSYLMLAMIIVPIMIFAARLFPTLSRE